MLDCSNLTKGSTITCIVSRFSILSLSSLRLKSQMKRLRQVTKQMLIYLSTLSLFYYVCKKISYKYFVILKKNIIDLTKICVSTYLSTSKTLYFIIIDHSLLMKKLANKTSGMPGFQKVSVIFLNQ